MYNVERFVVPEGTKLNDYAKELTREIQAGKNVEENKNILFRMTYPIMINYVQKFKNLYAEEYLVSDMAIAFMRTLHKFDPDAENASFTNYYKIAAKTMIINNYYGKYKRDEASRNLKRSADSLTSSLDDEVFDKNGLVTGTWYDLIADETCEVDKEFLKIEMHHDVLEIIDDIFGNNKRAARSKTMFIEYIESIMFDKGIKRLDIANKHNVSRSAVTRVVNGYIPKLKEELIKRGY